MLSKQVIVIGAGPYGLAAMAHLRSRGIDLRGFGDAMAFWQRRMPKGMFLRSAPYASNISDPLNALDLPAYCKDHGTQLSAPVPLKLFISYGRWFQRQIAPDLDPRSIVKIEPHDGGFTVGLDDGSAMRANRVVIAAGIAPFAYRPEEFHGLSPKYVTHSVDHDDLSLFAGKRVLVVGGGQSAIESAALLGESGAEVEVVMRGPHVRWLSGVTSLHSRSNLLGRMLHAATDVGPPGLSPIVARPKLFTSLSPSLQRWMAYRSIRPAAAAWLRQRVEGVRITAGRHVRLAESTSSGVRILLDDGSKREPDHVLLATGYRVDISRYQFLSPTLLRRLMRENGYPILGTGFESSVLGLHFLGAPAALSHGPLMRFVSGTDYAARALARRVIDTGAIHAERDLAYA